MIGRFSATLRRLDQFLDRHPGVPAHESTHLAQNRHFCVSRPRIDHFLPNCQRFCQHLLAFCGTWGNTESVRESGSIRSPRWMLCGVLLLLRLGRLDLAVFF